MEYWKLFGYPDLDFLPECLIRNLPKGKSNAFLLHLIYIYIEREKFVLVSFDYNDALPVF